MMPRAVADKLTSVLERVFQDFQDSIESRARDESNHDASTAMYGVSSAISSMDIGYTVREALEIPHDNNSDPGSAI